MPAPDRVGANAAAFAAPTFQHTPLSSQMRRRNSPRHGAVGGWHFFAKYRVEHYSEFSLAKSPVRAVNHVFTKPGQINTP